VKLAIELHFDDRYYIVADAETVGTITRVIVNKSWGFAPYKFTSRPYSPKEWTEIVKFGDDHAVLLNITDRFKS